MAKARLHLRGSVWYVVISWSENGIKRQKWLSTRTSDQERAEDQLRRIKEELRAGLDLSVDPTVEEWLRKWHSTGVGLGNWRESTTVRYAQSVGRLVPEIGDRTLRSLKPSDVELLAARLGARCKTHTVRSDLSVLSSALREAEHEGIVLRNVAAIARWPNVPRRRKAALAIEEAARLLRVAYSRPDVWGYYIELGLLTGLRRGELLGLLWEHIDLDAATLRVVQQRQQRRGHGAMDVPPKSESSIRGVALPSSAVDLLRALRTRYAQESLALGIMPPRYVFARRRAGVWGPYSATKALRHIYRQAGVDTTQPSHALRYTQAALLEAVHAEGITRQHRLGHARIEETEGYTAADIDAQRISAERAAQLLAGRKPRSKEATKRARS